jgi:hypothetical protein
VSFLVLRWRRAESHENAAEADQVLSIQACSQVAGESGEASDVFLVEQSLWRCVAAVLVAQPQVA